MQSAHSWLSDSSHLHPTNFNADIQHFIPKGHKDGDLEFVVRPPEETGPIGLKGSDNEIIAGATDPIENAKVLIGVSSCMTWARTSPNPDEPETALRPLVLPPWPPAIFAEVRPDNCDPAPPRLAPNRTPPHTHTQTAAPSICPPRALNPHTSLHRELGPHPTRTRPRRHTRPWPWRATCSA